MDFRDDYQEFLLANGLTLPQIQDMSNEQFEMALSTLLDANSPRNFNALIDRLDQHDELKHVQNKDYEDEEEINDFGFGNGNLDDETALRLAIEASLDPTFFPSPRVPKIDISGHINPKRLLRSDLTQQQQQKKNNVDKPNRLLYSDKISANRYLDQQTNEFGESSRNQMSGSLYSSYRTFFDDDNNNENSHSKTKSNINWKPSVPPKRSLIKGKHSDSKIIREMQDIEYLLAQDQAKQKELEESMKKEAELSATRMLEIRKENQRNEAIRLFNLIPNEPKYGTMIAVTMTNGKRIVRRFDPTSSGKYIYAWVSYSSFNNSENEKLYMDSFKLIYTIGTTIAIDKERTLEDQNLLGRVSLVIAVL